MYSPIVEGQLELMGGELVLILDGDLFKALVRLPLALSDDGAAQAAASEKEA